MTLATPGPQNPRRISVATRTDPPPAAQAAAAKAPADSVGAFIALEIEARQCADADSLRFVIANATRKLADYDEAYLAEPGLQGSWRITRASSVHAVNQQAPRVAFLTRWLKEASQPENGGLSEAKLYNLQLDAVRFGLEAGAADQPYALWLPLKDRTGKILGGLLALRSVPWRPQSVSLLIPLAAAYGHAWRALEPQVASPAAKVARVVSKKRLMLGACAALLVAGFVPVPMSSLAPAEVVARAPFLVTAPADGVIGDILLPPGARVEKDTPVLTFVDVDLRNRWEVAKSSKAVAQAKYFKAVQTATATQKNMEDVAIAKAELDVASSELAYAQEMLGRTVVKAPSAGLLIYSAKSDWIGRPVRTGERIMEIGDPASTELKIEVPVSDALTLADGGDVSFFLDGDPLTAVKANVTRSSYRPALNGEHQMVYRVHAGFSDGETRRIGLRGVARVSSQSVPLAFYLFRKPIASLRQRFGL